MWFATILIHNKVTSRLINPFSGEEIQVLRNENGTLRRIYLRSTRVEVERLCVCLDEAEKHGHGVAKRKLRKLYKHLCRKFELDPKSTLLKLEIKLYWLDDYKMRKLKIVPKEAGNPTSYLLSKKRTNRITLSPRTLQKHLHNA